MLSSKVGAYPSGAIYGAPSKDRPQVLTRVEVTKSSKQSSFPRQGNNYCYKKLYDTGPWGLYYKNTLDSWGADYVVS